MSIYAEVQFDLRECRKQLQSEQKDRDEECEAICALLPGEADGRTLTQYVADSVGAIEAERDALKAVLLPAYETTEQAVDVLHRLSAAEARVEALQPFLKHRHGCAALATAGGMFAPGPCTCGLAALAVSGNQPQ